MKKILLQFDELTEPLPVKPSVSKVVDNLLLDGGGAPNVDFLDSTVPQMGGGGGQDVPKSTIGVRKIQPKKSGLGARKGLGATRVKTNFADLEQQATMADNMKEAVMMQPEKTMTVAEEEDAIQSVRLAYHDLSLKKNREEERLKSVDPTKAKQMERLGMGFNLKAGGVSHSALTDMQTINQESAPKSSGSMKAFDRETNSDFFDDYSTSMYSSSSTSSIKQDRELMMMGFETIEPIETSQKNIQSMFMAGSGVTNTKKPSSSISGMYFIYFESPPKVIKCSNISLGIRILKSGKILFFFFLLLFVFRIR